MSKSKKKPVVAARDSFPSPDDIFSPGTTIDNRFRIIARLSKGPRGQVYVAEHSILEERLAIRVLHDSSSLGNDLEDRFLEEAKTLARLNHKNIVKLFDAGVTSQGYLFSTMELIEGLSLDRWRANKNDPDFDTPDDARFLDALLLYMRQVADGVMECHEIGVFHHNLKPSNIYLTETERSSAFVRIPKIIDFGHVRKRPAGAKPHRDDAYRAPELRRGETGDGRADIFSLGVVFYEMLTGKLPHAGLKGMDDGDIDTQVVPPSLKNPYVPKKIDALVMRALAWRPEDRFSTMFDFVEAFDAALVLHKTRVTTDVEISPGMIIPDKENHFLKFGLIALTLVIAGTAVVGGVIINRLGSEPENTSSMQTPNTPLDVPPSTEELAASPTVVESTPIISDNLVDAGHGPTATDAGQPTNSSNVQPDTSAFGTTDSNEVEAILRSPIAKLESGREGRGKRNRKEIRRLIKEANRSMDNREWETAGELFQSAIVINPRRADAWAGLSRAYFQLKRFDRAIEYMNRALSMRNRAAWRMLLGEYLDGRGDKSEAIETWQAILKDFPRAKQSVKDGVRKNLKQAGAL